MNKVFRLVECHRIVPDLHQVSHGLIFDYVDAIVDVLTNRTQIHRLFDNLFYEFCLSLNFKVIFFFKLLHIKREHFKIGVLAYSKIESPIAIRSGN